MESFKKQIQQKIQKCNAVIDKNQQKYLIQIKPTARILNTLINMHKDDKPIRPVINNIQAPS